MSDQLRAVDKNAGKKTIYEREGVGGDRRINQEPERKGERDVRMK